MLSRHPPESAMRVPCSPPNRPARNHGPDVRGTHASHLNSAAVSLTHLPMAQTYAVTFSAPLIAAVLASLLLGERAGLRRWLYILAGFGGAVVALDPGGVGLQPALLYPLAMAAANA